MPDSIDDFAAENRRRIKSNNSRFVGIDTNAERNLFYSVSFASVEVETTVRRRDTGDQLIAGHADESKGFGRGTFGEDRGGFEDKAPDTESVLVGGLSTVAAIVSGGSATEPSTVEYGYGTDDADRLDEALSDPADSVDVIVDVTDATVTIRGDFGSTEFVGTGFETGVSFADGTLLSRATGDANQSPTDEIRFVAEFEVGGNGTGSSIFTNAGRSRIASAIGSAATSDIMRSFVFSETRNIDQNTETIPDAAFEADVASSTEDITITNEGRVDSGDVPDAFTPGTVREVAIADDDDTVIWSTTTRELKVTDESAFTVEMAVRFV